MHTRWLSQAVGCEEAGHLRWESKQQAIMAAPPVADTECFVPAAKVL